MSAKQGKAHKYFAFNTCLYHSASWQLVLVALRRHGCAAVRGPIPATTADAAPELGLLAATTDASVAPLAVAACNGAGSVVGAA